MDDAYDLRTPEQVDLAYDLAGLGSRFLAILLDSLIQFAVMAALILAFGLGSSLLAGGLRRAVGVDSTLVFILGLTIAVLAVFLVTWGYFIIFELVWNGQTPGKRVVGIRALTSRGEPVTLVHTLVRNLVRLVDFLPTSYTIGAICILATPRSQRLGDLAAGTIVVRERRDALPHSLPPLPAGEELPPQVAAAFSPRDVALARDFLLRADDLAPTQRQALGVRIAMTLRERIAASGQSLPSDLSDEHLLCRVAALRR